MQWPGLSPICCVLSYELRAEVAGGRELLVTMTTHTPFPAPHVVLPTHNSSTPNPPQAPLSS